MAFYNPPGAPQQGGMTVDSSRYMNAPAAPVVNPFDKAYELKKQAMDMKRMERKEKSDISQEVASNMQNDIFSLGDDASKFNPDAILQGGKFNEAELQKRRFTSKLKSAAWGRYQSNAKKAGGIADRQTFETAWGQGKLKEDDKILNEMWMDVQSNKMSDNEFGLATRNETFRNMWKDVNTARKEQFQKELEAADMKRYTPGFETSGFFGEKLWGTGPTENTVKDIATSPGAVGTTVGLAGLGTLASPTAREYVGGKISRGYSAMGYGSGSRQAIQTNLDELLAKGKELGRTKATKKYGATPESTYKDYLESDEYKLRRKVLKDKEKARTINAKEKADLEKIDKKVGELEKEVSDRKTARAKNNKKIKAAKAKLAKVPSIRLEKLVKDNPRKLRFGRRALPFMLGAHAGAGLGGGAARAMGFGETGQQIGEIAGGVGGAMSVGRVVKKLASPKTLKAIAPIIKKFAPKLAAKMVVSGGLAASGIGTAAGVAGLVWTAYDVIQLAKEVPELMAALTK